MNFQNEQLTIALQVFFLIVLVAMTAFSFMGWAAGLRFWRFLMSFFGALIGAGMLLGFVLGVAGNNTGGQS